MKKIFIKLNEEKKYRIPEEAQTRNFLLQDLWDFLRAWGKKDSVSIYNSSGLCWEWLTLDKTDDGKMVYLWSPASVKREAKVDFISQEQKEAFNKAYDAYCTKRWNDVPKLHMTVENYIELILKWQKIVLKEQPIYFIISQDATGFVDLVGKQELSQQDLVDMKDEHQKYLKYQMAYNKYIKDHPERVDDLWRSPADSEYEADWQKYLEEPLD